MFRRRPRPGLPNGTDFDVIVVGMSIEDHWDCEPREGLADPDSREAARIAVGALRKNGLLLPSLGGFDPDKRPEGSWRNRVWHSDVPELDPNVAIIRDSLGESANYWADRADEVARVAVAILVQNQRLELVKVG